MAPMKVWVKGRAGKSHATGVPSFFSSKPCCLNQMLRFPFFPAVLFCTEYSRQPPHANLPTHSASSSICFEELPPRYRGRGPQAGRLDQADGTGLPVSVR